MLLCTAGSAIAVASEAPAVTGITTDKAMYAPGETANFTITLDNSGSGGWSGTLHLTVTHLETAVAELSTAVSVSAGETSQVTMQWTLPQQDYTGYLAKAYIDESSGATTALDCSSDFTVFPRYGYVSDYPAGQTAAQTAAMVEELATRYHINAYQLYDWMWRHETLLKREGNAVSDTWEDLFGRTISRQTIEDYIDAIHSNNGAAMAYVMSYAAREGYTDHGVNPAVGLFTDQNHASQLNVDFGDGSTYLWLFNPENEEWQAEMIAQYLDAMNTVGFDGLQIDQMG